MVAHIGAIHLIMVTVVAAHQAVVLQVTAMATQDVVVLERLDKDLLAAAAKANTMQVAAAALGAQVDQDEATEVLMVV